MSKNHRRLLEILRQHAIDGRLRTTEDEVRSWVGDDAKHWDIHLMINELNDKGSFKTYLVHQLEGRVSQFDIEFRR